MPSDALVECVSGGLTPVGRLATKTSAEIGASCFSVGVETLDRGMWDFDRGLPAIVPLGAKWARVQTGWGKCETTRGVYDFAWLDHIVDALLAAGIEPWFNVGYGNQLYLPDAPHPTAVGWTPIHDEGARAGWAGFTAALAQHFAGRVSWYEVWNEPDISAFWTPYESTPESYTDLAILTAQSLRRGDRNAKVVGGAVAAALYHRGLEWIHGCFEHGLGEHIDAFSFHQYTPTPEREYETIAPSLKALVHSYRPGLPIWQGESGAPSKAVPGQALADCVFDEDRQARWNTRRALLDLRHGMTLSAFFCAADFQFYIVKDQLVEKEYYFGLLAGKEFRPKPSFYAAQSLCTLFAGDIRRADEANPVLRLPAEANPSEARAVVFETSYGPLLAYYQAHHMMQPLTPAAGELSVWLPHRWELREPVLIDPISQRAYAVPSEPAKAGVQRWRVPVGDWPLLLGERARLPLVARS